MSPKHRCHSHGKGSRASEKWRNLPRVDRESKWQRESRAGRCSHRVGKAGLRRALHLAAQHEIPTGIWAPGWRLWTSPSGSLHSVCLSFRDLSLSLLAFRTKSSRIPGNTISHLFLKMRAASPPLTSTCFYTYAKKSYQRRMRVCVYVCVCTRSYVQDTAISYRGARNGLPKISRATSLKS
jgi:hypothetical protein